MTVRYRSTIFILLVVLSAAIVFTSCVPEPLDVKNIPALKPRIVVSTQIVPDQSIVVFLSKSIGALDAGKGSDPDSILNGIIVDDATILIRYGDEYDTLTNLGNGVYGNITTPIVAGRVYTLEVKSPTMGNVIASTVAQEAIPFLDVAAKLYKGEYDSLAQIDYTIEDPTDKNFYMINVQRFSRTQRAKALLNPRLFTHVMTDEEFNGTIFEDSFRVFFQGFDPGDTVAVSLTNISEAYYEYVKKRVDNRFDLTSFATEPFNYPTNITGGYGYFNIQQPDIRIFRLE